MPAASVPDSTALALTLFTRNLQALSQAAQTFMSGTLASSGQQMETLRSLAEQSMKSFVDVAGEANPKEIVRKSFDAVRSSMQNATAVSNIFSELSARNGGAAAQVLQDRAYAALDEMQSLAITALDNAPAATSKP
jgi:hypothetical protein